jgi:hypothetical protein
VHLSDKAYGAKERRVVLKKTEKKIIKINKIRKYLNSYVCYSTNGLGRYNKGIVSMERVNEG